MKAMELRIGNWVNEQGLELQVGMITTSVVASLTAIPLTEEWLLKFGLEKHGSTMNLIFEYNIYFERFGNQLWLCCAESASSKLIEFVHQAQNIYFALTGEELTIKV